MRLVVLDSVDTVDIDIRDVGSFADDDVLVLIRPGSQIEINSRHNISGIDAQQTSDRFVAQTLDDWRIAVQSALAPKGLDQVCGLSLWELSKDSLFYYLRNRIEPVWRISQLLKSSIISHGVFFLSNGGTMSVAAKAIHEQLEVHGASVGKSLCWPRNRKTPLPKEPLGTRIVNRVRYEAMRWGRILPSYPKRPVDEIMVSAFYPTNMRQLVSIRSALLPDSYARSTLFAGRPRLLEVLRTIDPDAIGIEQYSNVTVLYKVDKLKRRFFKEFAAWCKTAPARNPVAKLTIELANGWLLNHYGYITWCVYTQIEALKVLRPKAIATTTQWGIPAKAHVMAAHVLFGIPTLWIQHGLADCDAFTIPLYFDRLAVWGEKDRELWMQWGVKEDLISVTGAVSFDKLAGPMPSQEIIRKKLPVSNELPLVTFTTQPVDYMISDQEHREVLKMVLEVVRGMPDVNFIIKPHPSETTEIYRKRVGSDEPKNLKIIKDIDTDNLIKASDILMTICSTTGMTAVALDRPIVELNASNAKDRAPYFAEGVAVLARSRDELCRAIKSILSEAATRVALRRNRARFVSSYLSRIDGLAATRCAAELVSLGNRGSICKQKAMSVSKLLS